MTRDDVSRGISAEEIAVALDGIGLEASADRVRELGAVLDPDVAIKGARAPAVRELVREASAALSDAPARSMDAGKALLDSALEVVGGRRTEWSVRGNFISPWEFCEVSVGGAAKAVRVGVSSGGVVSVNGDPFSPRERKLNVELDAVVRSLTAVRDFREGGVRARAPVDRAAARERVRSFKASPETIRAAELVFLAKAHVGLVAPKVEAYQRQILAEGQWQIREDFAERAGRTGEVILDPARSYLMSDEDFAVYNERCHRARDTAGLYVEEKEQCPKLVAEHELLKAKWLLAEAMEPVTGLSRDQVTGLAPKKFDEYIELTLRLLAPHVDPERIKSKLNEPASVGGSALAAATESRPEF